MNAERLDKIIKFLNKEIDKEAKKLGKTVITEQSDLSGKDNDVKVKSKKHA